MRQHLGKKPLYFSTWIDHFKKPLYFSSGEVTHDNLTIPKSLNFINKQVAWYNHTTSKGLLQRSFFFFTNHIPFSSCALLNPHFKHF
jgi:hypothetical protein